MVDMQDEIQAALDRAYIEAIREGRGIEEVEPEIADWYGPKEWPAVKTELEQQAHSQA